MLVVVLKLESFEHLDTSKLMTKKWKNLNIFNCRSRTIKSVKYFALVNFISTLPKFLWYKISHFIEHKWNTSHKIPSQQNNKTAMKYQKFTSKSFQIIFQHFFLEFYRKFMRKTASRFIVLGNYKGNFNWQTTRKLWNNIIHVYKLKHFF